MFTFNVMQDTFELDPYVQYHTLTMNQTPHFSYFTPIVFLTIYHVPTISPPQTLMV